MKEVLDDWSLSVSSELKHVIGRKSPEEMADLIKFVNGIPFNEPALIEKLRLKNMSWVLICRQIIKVSF